MKRKKMYRKYMVFGAGICAVLILCSFSSAQSVKGNTGNIPEKRYIFRPNIDPLIANAGGPYKGSVHQDVQFEGSATGGKPPYKYNWDFGDGTTGIGKNPTHEYLEKGNYKVILKVIDDNGKSNKDNTTVEIGTWHLKACFINDKTSIKEGETVEFEGCISNIGFEDTPSGEYEAWIEEFVFFAEDGNHWKYYNPLIDKTEFDSIPVDGEIKFDNDWVADKTGRFRAVIRARAGNVTVFGYDEFLVIPNFPDDPNNNSTVIDYEYNNTENTGSDILFFNMLKNRTINYRLLILKVIKHHLYLV